MHLKTQQEIEWSNLLRHGLFLIVPFEPIQDVWCGGMISATGRYIKTVVGCRVSSVVATGQRTGDDAVPYVMMPSSDACSQVLQFHAWFWSRRCVIVAIRRQQMP